MSFLFRDQSIHVRFAHLMAPVFVVGSRKEVILEVILVDYTVEAPVSSALPQPRELHHGGRVRGGRGNLQQVFKQVAQQMQRKHICGREQRGRTSVHLDREV